MTGILLIYLLAGASLFLMPASLRRLRGIWMAVLQFAFFFWFLFQSQGVIDGINRTESYPWIPELDFAFDFLLDGLSLTFSLLITGIGGLVFLFAHAYMKPYARTDLFFFQLWMFSGAMLGLVLSANLLQLFVFWELTSVLSFFLIQFHHEKEKARKSAFTAFYITTFGGLCLLSGILLLGDVAGSYTFAGWLEAAEAIRQSPFYVPGLLLILCGIFTKSAQFPFHFWLPGAMQAPTPVSAYLHSATMVKAGFFLLARLNVILGGTPQWSYIVSGAGLLTMLLGAWFAITRKELKSLLADTTLYALGVLVLLMGINTLLSLKAAMLFLLVHALYKATLFMITGTIDKKTGTREMALLGGLRKEMPYSFLITLLAVLSMAGFPPMLGFLGKELIYEATLQLPDIALAVLVIGVFSNVLMVAVSASLVIRVFLGPRKPALPAVKEKQTSLLILVPLLLALSSLVLGLLPGLLGNALLQSALEAMHPSPGNVEIKLWHGFNTVLLLSALTVALGGVLAWFLLCNEGFMQRWHRFNASWVRFHFRDVFFQAIEAVVRFSDKKNQLIQHGYHRYYIITIILISSGLLWYLFAVSNDEMMLFPPGEYPFYILGLVGIMILGSLLSVLSDKRISAIIGMGVTGYGLALLFMYYSAIDLAITQILAETLTVVLFVLVLQRMPRFARLSSRLAKFRDLGIALSFGSIMTLLALKASHTAKPPELARFYLENSYPNAFGSNVVNVILVDFRALDTLGEVVVLVVAALGVFVLLSKNRRSE